MTQQLLLLEDVYGLGRKGEVVSPKPGHARNYLLPYGHALVADKRTLKMQERLQEERAKQAAEDLKEANAIFEALDGKVISTEVKVDPNGHMYGSVSAADVVELIKGEANIELDRRFVHLPHPLKQTGVHEIELRLKEGIKAQITLKVIPEGGVLPTDEEEATEEGEDPSVEASEEGGGVVTR